MDKATNWITTIKKLSNIRRFSQLTMARPENVLEHTAMVTMIALQITEVMDAEELVKLAILKKAICHDVEESEIGDVARPAKYFSEKIRSAFRELEAYIAHGIFNRAGMEHCEKYWLGAKMGRTGAVVAFCDSIAAVIVMHDESYIRSNKSMSEAISGNAFQYAHEAGLAVALTYPETSELINEYLELIQKMRNDLCM